MKKFSQHSQNLQDSQNTHNIPNPKSDLEQDKQDKLLLEVVESSEVESSQDLSLATSPTTSSATSASVDFKDSQDAQHKDSHRRQRMQKIIHGAYDLSLGISIVVAILLGVGIGFLLWKAFESQWLLFLGIFWGVAAAGLNIYKAYKRTKKELDMLAKDPKYNYKKPEESSDDSDEWSWEK